VAVRLVELAGEGGLERHREELGRMPGVVVADGGDAGEVLAECLDVTVDLHDGIMTSE
jgi:hypothetical protein